MSASLAGDYYYFLAANSVAWHVTVSADVMFNTYSQINSGLPRSSDAYPARAYCRASSAGLLRLLISAFDDLSEFPAPFREAELCWAKAGIPFCDVIADQTLDVEQINAAVEVHFALACRKVGSIILAHPAGWMTAGRIWNR